MVLDVELLRPGEGEETAAKRLLERVFTEYPRFFDAVAGDALYFDAPFIKFCRDHQKHVIVTAKGENRLLVQDAAGLFAHQQPGGWVDERRAHRAVLGRGRVHLVRRRPQPLRFLRTEETVRKRERIAGQWQRGETTNFVATTLTKSQLLNERAVAVWPCRWGIENDCFNTLATHWGLNHCFKHAAQAIVNFLLMLFVVYALMQSFWLRNLKPAPRALDIDRVGAGLGSRLGGLLIALFGRSVRAP